MNFFHILNGDALLAQFPASVPGERLVVRECLIEGPRQADSLAAFFQQRADFLHATYDPANTYFAQSAPDLQQILQLPSPAAVTLWFEDDLYCQTNLWFVGFLLEKAAFSGPVFLARPPEHTPYGFGGLDEGGLVEAFEKRQKLASPAMFAALWRAYRAGDDGRLLHLAEQSAGPYPFLLPAVQAQLDRRPQGELPGRPLRSLQTIIAELDTPTFGPVFREFCRRESIYGFGDLQVKRMYDALMNQA